LEKDEETEEKMVKQLLTEAKEAKDVTLSSVPVAAVGPVVAASDSSAAARPNARRQQLTQKHRVSRAGGETRSYGFVRNHVQREAVIEAWQDEQSKVTGSV
jgi:hypothetical protein